MRSELQREGEREAFPQITEQPQITPTGLSGFDQTEKKKKVWAEKQTSLSLASTPKGGVWIFYFD